MRQISPSSSERSLCINIQSECSLRADCPSANSTCLISVSSTASLSRRSVLLYRLQSLLQAFTDFALLTEQAQTAKWKGYIHCWILVLNGSGTDPGIGITEAKVTSYFHSTNARSMT